jgi:hypothetical protein
MTKNRKIPTEREMIELLRRGQVFLAPLSLRFLEDAQETGGNATLDASIEILWGENKAKFALECKRQSTPKAFQEGLYKLRLYSLREGYQPMLFTSFLSESQLGELERWGISGIDLCGNGVVIVPGKFSAFRNGGENRFSSSAPIKNVYRWNSSMVGRTLLVRSKYDTVEEILDEVNQKNMLVKRWNSKPMSISTVYKSLKSLEDDLIIQRKKIISLLQPDKLLEKLSENYSPPRVKDRVTLKVSESESMIRELLLSRSRDLGIPLVATGKSSVRQYAVMQRGDVLSIYCPRLDMLLSQLPGSQTDRFPNLELIETDDEPIFSDARQDGDFWWASPVQVFLELMAGDKRDRETAEQVKSYILKEYDY